MTDWQKRVIEEKNQLDEKRLKLKTFLGTDDFRSLSGAEQDRLIEQASAMKTYSDILAERIAQFTL